MKIKTRITLWFTLLVVFLTLVSNSILVFATTKYLYNYKITSAYEKVNDVKQLITSLQNEHEKNNLSFDLENYNLLSETIKQQGTRVYEGAYLQATNLKGIIFSSSPNLGDKILPIFKDGTIRTLYLNLPSKNGIQEVKILYLSSTIYYEDKKIAYLQVGMPLTENDELLNQMIVFVLLNTIISIGAAIFLGKFLSKRSLEPMLSVTNEVNNMAGKNLLKPIDKSNFSEDEIGLLVNTFNELIKRISDVFNSHQIFISDASHELRSPLTAIKGYAQFILKRGINNPELVKEGIQVVIKESDRLERLVNDMLYLARSGEKSLLTEGVEIVSIIRQLVSELKPLHPNLNIENSDIKAFVTGHSDSLKRVFINLINNALKAVEKGGVVNITFQIKNNYINIMVTDNGSGIEPEHLNHIFERFYRTDSSRERDKGGSGLGLSIVKEIVENHHGNVSVISKKDYGTTFTVSIPLISIIYQEEKSAVEVL